MNKKIVIALGGNALGNSPKDQLQLVKETARPLVELVKNGYELVITHGNGPQVGMINLATEIAHKSSANTPQIPFPECGAMSQGYIGYHLQQAIYEELKRNGVRKSVVSVVTQVVVDERDEAFQNPTKPIGKFYNKEEAKEIEKNSGYTFIEDAGRGYRRVVASPKPIRIVEIETIETLVKAGHIVIAVGGGGIPVIESENGLKGVDAVIDKDRSAAKLAADMNADRLIILTAVDKVAINFNKPNQKDLDEITINKLQEYIDENQFAKGSMLPKVEACMEFVKANQKGKAIIASLENASAAIKGETGTIIRA
ncbi:MAG: carbamate kinase [Tissierellia bacterium]|nr:carbamate kinase [Tissierellia bacterium]